MRYFVANWKANMNFQDICQWLNVFLEKLKECNKTIILCPPFPYLSYVREQTKQYSFIKIGSQDISQFEKGKFTGEVNGYMLKDFAEYSIAGHNERRTYSQETDTIIAEKVRRAKKEGIEPILCVRNEKDLIPQEVRFVVYEPVFAIGTGQNEPLEKVLEMKKKIRLPQDCVFLYGGSVNEQDVLSYFQSEEIDGFLIGSASLNPSSFYRIITNTI